MSKQVESVKASLSLLGGKAAASAKVLDVAPAVTGHIKVSADGASKLAVSLRESEAALAAYCSEHNCSLERIKDGTLASLVGPSIANPAQDLYVQVQQRRRALKQQLGVLEADLLAALTTPEVRQQIAEYATTVADSKRDLMGRNEAVMHGARTLKDVISMSPTLREEMKRARIGNLVSTRTGDVVTDDEFVARHENIANALHESVIV